MRGLIKHVAETGDLWTQAWVTRYSSNIVDASGGGYLRFIYDPPVYAERITATMIPIEAEPWLTYTHVPGLSWCSGCERYVEDIVSCSACGSEL